MLVKGGHTEGRVKKKNSVEEQQQENPKTAGFQVQEYIFDRKTPRKHASKEDWLRSYRERDDKTFYETTELYSEAS